MEKEQLTLEMLCSYLPYKLELLIVDFGIEQMIGFINNEVITTEDNADLSIVKPIFHPLSELEGTEQWNEIVSEHNYPDFGHFERSVLSGHAPHRLIIELVKEHFWIYDQSYFEKKIILDINELNK